MAGDATNAEQWGNADVYVARPAGSAGPVNVIQPYVAPWAPVGLLDGEAGFTESRDEDTSEKYAWGGLLIRRSRSKHTRRIKFVCLEDNAVTFGLVNPGSSRTAAGGLTTSQVKVPTYDEFSISFETRDGNKIKRRTVKRATVDEIADVTESESDVTTYEITVLLYPEADGTLYTDLEGMPTS